MLRKNHKFRQGDKVRKSEGDKKTSRFKILKGKVYLQQLKGMQCSSLSIRRFWGKRGKMEAKKGESSPPPQSKFSSPLAH